MSEEKQGELEVINQDIVIQSESGKLVEMAINKDLDIDKLERVIAMHRSMKEG